MTADDLRPDETDERTERADWRSSIVGTIGLTLLIGVWLIASTAVLSYDKPTLPVIWGAVIVVLSLIRLLGPTSSRTLALTLALAGAFTTLSAFLADDPAGPTANIALMGLAVVVLAMVGLAADSESAIASRP